MEKKRWMWIILSLLFAVILFIVIQLWGGLNPAAETLTKDEAQSLVKDRYQGEVTEIKLTDNQYLIEMTKEDTLYKITLDAKNGEVLSLFKSGSKPDNQQQNTSKPLTEEEIKNIILSEAKGELVSIEKKEINGNMIYQAVVKEKNQEIKLEVDSMSGSILTSTPNKIKEPPKKLTEAEASQAAVKEVNGTVDDIELETNGDQNFYLVKIETEDGREAVVQIHAITGIAESITWDPDDDNQDDEDDNHDEDD